MQYTHAPGRYLDLKLLFFFKNISVPINNGKKNIYGSWKYIIISHNIIITYLIKTRRSIYLG